MRAPLLLGLIFLISSHPSARAGEKDTLKLESISETDLSFFTTNPKLPWDEDPFQKHPGFTTVEPEKNPFKLEGVLYHKNDPTVLINGKAYHIGERVKDRKVIAIGENFVVLKKHDSEIELTLPPIGEIKDELPEYYEADEEEKGEESK